MSNLRFTKSKKATTRNRSFFIVLILVGSFFTGLSQETNIYHFQRNGELETIILPSDTFNSSLFVIPFPDTMYTAGSITIKKLKLKDLKLQVNLVFSDNTYTQLTYSVKKKNRKEFIQLIESTNSSFSWKERLERRKCIFILSPQSKTENL